MAYRQLKFFAAVAEELHFTRAAARPRVAQPHWNHEMRRRQPDIRMGRRGATPDPARVARALKKSTRSWTTHERRRAFLRGAGIQQL